MLQPCGIIHIYDSYCRSIALCTNVVLIWFFQTPSGGRGCSRQRFIVIFSPVYYCCNALLVFFAFLLIAAISGFFFSSVVSVTVINTSSGNELCRRYPDSVVWHKIELTNRLKL